MVYAQPRICPGKWDAQTSLGFEIQMDHLIPARWPDQTRPSDSQQKKKKKKKREPAK